MNHLLKNLWVKRVAVALGVVLVGYGGLKLIGGPRRLFGKTWKATPLSVAAGGKPGFTLVPGEQTGVTFVNTLSDEIAGKNRVLDIGSGVALGDYDGDGWCDVYLGRMDGDNVLYRNLGDWRFEDVTAKAGVACPNTFTTGATFADIDGDADLDLIVTSIPGLHCFHNNGNGTFTDATADVGLGSRTANTTVALGDVDGDGDLDLYLANYRPDSIKDTGNVRLQMVNGKLTIPPEMRDRLTVTPGGALQELGEPDVLYLNDGAGKFSAQSWTSGAFLDEDGAKLARPPLDWGLSATFRDVDGDSDPDLYVCNDFQSTDTLWINQGDGRFKAVDRLALRETSASSMGVDFSDVDRDGDLDFFVVDMLSPDHTRRNTQMPITSLIGGNLGEIENRPQIPRNTLFLNRGDGTYAECANYAGVAATNWTWTALFFDADLDGYEDIFVANGHARDVQDADTGARLDAMGDDVTAQQTYRLYPRLDVANVAFRNLGDARFEDASAAWGLDAVGISHGAAHADLDNDGDLDLVVNNFQHPAGLYRNDSPAPRVAVRLVGDAPNTEGVGATIRLTGGPVPVQSKEVVCGGLYLSGSDAVASFSAANPSAPLALDVVWRGGTRSVVEGVEPNTLYTIYESGSVSMTREKPPTSGAMFEDASGRLNHTHRENDFDDFARQPLLPKRLGRPGPGVAFHDLDGDGDDDLIVGTGATGLPAVFLNDGRGAFLPSSPGMAAPLTRDTTSVVAWTGSGNATGIWMGSSNFEDGDAVGDAAIGYTCVGGALAPGAGLGGQPSSTGPLAMADIDGDGDLDLFLGGRTIPGRYPEPASSLIALNDGEKFVVDPASSSAFASVGLVNGAVFSDLDGDGDPDLALALDWGPVTVFLNDGGRFTNATEALGLSETHGWWNGVTTGDFDEDGRLDLVVTNWGENVVYPVSADRPARVYAADVDGNGTLDVVEAYREGANGPWLPVRRRDAVVGAIPSLGAKFPTFESYAEATLDQLYGPSLASARSLTATTLAQTVFFNRGGRVEAKPLPVEAQLAPSFGVAVADFDGDGHDDIFLAQNFFAVPPRTPRFDAGRGLILRGDGKGGFEPVPGQHSGVKVYGDARAAAVADIDGDARPDLVVGQNGAATKLYRNALGKPGVRVRLRGAVANPDGVGAVVRLVYGDRKGPAREVHAGGGYLAQDSSVLVLGGVEGATAVWVRWPDGKESTAPVAPGTKEVLVER